ncbi:hypothetical protein [Streptomyces sp. NBC_01716]|uniref:hypothetical protein n=1 Tax=Streptomyces sp. NBC_01716 TaxID=2975917 RepID=UPI002E3237F9|nr:hypothetical protein [Streptomyces sp. NBC_01716]
MTGPGNWTGLPRDLADTRRPSLWIFQPLIETTAGSNDAYWGPTDPTTVVGGSTLPVRTKLFVAGRRMQTAIPNGHLTLTLPAGQLAAAGLTARQLAATAHFTLDTSTTALPWTVEADGSLSVHCPGFGLPAPSNSNLDSIWRGIFDLAAALDVTPGTLVGNLRLDDSAGRLFTTRQVAIRFAEPAPHPRRQARPVRPRQLRRPLALPQHQSQRPPLHRTDQDRHRVEHLQHHPLMASAASQWRPADRTAPRSRRRRDIVKRRPARAQSGCVKRTALSRNRW